MKIQYILSLTILLSFGAYASQAPGTLDPSFDGDGKVTTDFDGGQDEAFAVLRRSNGKIIAVGSATVAGNFDFGLVQYNPDGTIDTTFGDNGFVTTDFDIGSVDNAFDALLQPDGKIVAVGQTDAEGDFDFALARYNIDGSLDETFGGDGLVTTDFGLDDVALAVIIQPDGKIVAAGYSGNTIVLARYNPDGSLDPDFSGGMVNTGITNIEIVLDLALQTDGKLVIASTDGGQPIFIRLESDGSFDMNFGINGVVTIPMSGILHAVVIQPDGKIIGGGITAGNFLLIRLNSDGTLDTSFGPAQTGIIITDLGGTDTIYDLALQFNGKIVAAGSSDAQGTFDFALARYNVDGTVDTTFGTNGFVFTNFAGNDQANAVLIQTNGKIVAAGGSNLLTAAGDFALARYFGDPFPFPSSALVDAIIAKYCPL